MRGAALAAYVEAGAAALAALAGEGRKEPEGGSPPASPGTWGGPGFHFELRGERRAAAERCRRLPDSGAGGEVTPPRGGCGPLPARCRSGRLPQSPSCG